MAKLRVKAPDGKTLVIPIPDGTAPAQYGDLAKAALAHYQQSTGRPNNPMAESLHDNYAAGEEVPVEQKLAQNAVDVGNTAGMAFSLPGMVKGVAGLGMRGLAAMTEGLAPAAEDASNWFGSRALQFSKSVLPESATKAQQVVDDATEYAMNPHPEVQEAMQKMGAKGGGDMTTALSTTNPGESMIKAGGPAELPPGPGGAAPEALDASVLPEGGNLGDPILSMSNLTPTSQLAATEAQLKTVGGAIDNVLVELNSTGTKFDPKSTVDALAGMYKRNASGQIIPAGSGSQQALFNQAVSRAIETIKSEATDVDGLVQKLDWQQANGIKKALQDLAEYGMKDNDPVNTVYQMAAKTVRETIDDQAQRALAAQGGDVSNFQTLRNAYSKLKSVQSALNNKVLTAMSAKNVAPIVRTSAAIGASGALLANGHPLEAMIPPALAVGDYVAREFGPLAMARGLKAAAGAPARLAKGGADLMAASGGASNAARGVSAGLELAGEDE